MTFYISALEILLLTVSSRVSQSRHHTTPVGHIRWWYWWLHFQQL